MSKVTKSMVKSTDGSDDIVMWLKKVKLVAKLQKIDDLSIFIPLYLEGAAFNVFDQLSDEQQRDANIIEKTLISAFSIDAYKAFDMLKSRSLEAGESVDVYLSEIRRLATLAGIESAEIVEDNLKQRCIIYILVLQVHN
jgi:hypothetical protein